MCYNNIRGNAKGEPQAKGRYKMNKTKMSKIFFFQIIEKRLKDLSEEVEELTREDLSFDEKLAKGNIIFGKLIELSAINSSARDIDYWRYIELDRKIYEVRERI